MTQKQMIIPFLACKSLSCLLCCGNKPYQEEKKVSLSSTLKPCKYFFAFVSSMLIELSSIIEYYKILYLSQTFFTRNDREIPTIFYRGCIAN